MDMPSSHDHAAHAHRPHHPVAEPSALKDPVCGMPVDASSEHHAEHAGRPFYFCSAKCQAKFSDDPKQPRIFGTSHGEGYVFTAPLS